MIFQSLIGLYDRLVATGDVPPYGFSVEDIGFVITIDNGGKLVGQPEDLRVKNKNNFDFHQSIVPYTNQVNVRANAAAKTPNFMVDKADYIFGMSGKSQKDVHHQSFKQLIDEVCQESKDQGVLAAKLFLTNWNPEDSMDLRDWKEICGPHGKWVAFRLQGDSGFIHERSEVKKLWAAYLAKESFLQGVNLIDGKISQLQSQYAQFKFGSGASLVSFNEVAYESYGKKKGDNAPISVEAEFKSSSALKFLLRSKTQRLRIGDTVTVFWAEKESPVETFMGQVLNPSVADKEAVLPVQKFLQAVHQGTLPGELEKDKGLKFYILGFSVNKARIALRFWHVCSVGDLMEHLHDHFDNLEMVRSEKDLPFPGIWHLLKETARETKDISPVLGGALMRSILTGAAYPQNLYQAVINRIRADQSKKNSQTEIAVPNVNYLRASILKAFLNRNYNLEVQMALDEARREDGYLLGRLFAVLESAQRDALGKINSSIKDRFYSAASTTPASVFPSLVRMAQNHIEKAEYGYLTERRIAQILEHIKKFPNYMDMQEQGLFAIGYYQQKNAISCEIKEALANKQSENQEVGNEQSN